MSGSSQKSQCEALDISALGAGPKVRSRTSIAWVGFKLSVCCGGEGGGASFAALIRFFFEQIYSVSLNAEK